MPELPLAPAPPELPPWLEVWDVALETALVRILEKSKGLQESPIIAPIAES